MLLILSKEGKMRQYRINSSEFHRLCPVVIHRFSADRYSLWECSQYCRHSRWSRRKACCGVETLIPTGLRTFETGVEYGTSLSRPQDWPAFLLASHAQKRRVPENGYIAPARMHKQGLGSTFEAFF